MRVDHPRRSHGLVALTILASGIAVGFALSGCRTASRTTVNTDRTLTAIVQSAEAKEIAALPEGSAKTLVTERCLLCHGAALITQQRKDAAAWGRTLTQMRTWGTPIQDQEQAALGAYLVEHFGPR
jgi:cytochrome c5